jgi:ATP-dependent DNA helicase RecQ
MTIHEILQNYWNYNNFRPLQEEIIQSILLGNDTLALLPTGGGKSVCFQVPALARKGICLVISPLIALMKDQVENLQARGIEAIAVVSGMAKREIDLALDQCVYGEVKFLYLSPERLLSELVKERIRYMDVNLIAVDEAHCISQWGYDFRPPYLHIASIRELHPGVPVLALTATATALVKKDILEKLKFRQNNIFQKSFERKNLSYVVQEEDNKFRKILDIIKGVKGCGIIYVRSRKETFETAQFLKQSGISADFYHAGLDAESRSQKQQSWKENRHDVMVATNAFGMGIDKPDVRFVIHKDIPESLEAYYQEAGRAGRDEQKAYAVLLYNHADRVALEKKFELSFPTVDEIKKVYHYLGNHYQLAHGAGTGLSFDLDIGEFCIKYKLDAIKTLNALKFLEKDAYLSFTESVFLPSRFKFQLSHEQLYNFQLQHKNYDLFVKTLLRSYGGCFDHYVRLREGELGRRTQMSLFQVVDTMKALESLDVLIYLPQTDHPQVTYTRARVDNNDLAINQMYIKERKAVFKSKMDAVLAYAESADCRSRMLLSYFDEHNASLCGVCDFCLENKRKEQSASRTDLIINELLGLISQKSLNVSELIRGITMGEENEKIEVLRLLLDAGKIKTDGDKYYL